MANNKSTRGASGDGSIRKKVSTRNGKTYTSWEGRFSLGTDPGTGKRLQGSVSGKTQAEVRKKLKAITAAIDEGTFTAPSKMTVAQWLDTWTADYLTGVKPRTRDSYAVVCRVHLKPSLGAIKLSALTLADIQKYYNRLSRSKEEGGEGLAVKTVLNIHGVFHKALEQARKLGIIRYNPADKPELPRTSETEIKPLEEQEIRDFLVAIRGDYLENEMILTLFTGLRQGEVCGLTWDCVDFKAGTLTIKQQLQRQRGTNNEHEYKIVPTKNSKIRVLTPAPSVMRLLGEQKTAQMTQRLKAGPIWSNDLDLVFTKPTGEHIMPHTLYQHFKNAVTAIGRPDARFHDLRHTYAVAALQAGDDLKTLQSNLGHHTAAFTMATYAHVSEKMKQESANRMEQFMRSVGAEKAV